MVCIKVLLCHFYKLVVLNTYVSFVNLIRNSFGISDELLLVKRRKARTQSKVKDLSIMYQIYENWTFSFSKILFLTLLTFIQHGSNKEGPINIKNNELLNYDKLVHFPHFQLGRSGGLFWNAKHQCIWNRDLCSPISLAEASVDLIEW